MSRGDSELLVEAVLFALGRPATVEEICRATGLSLEEVEGAIARLVEFYSPRSISVEERPDGWYMTLKPEYEREVWRLVPRPELTRAELRTLAVIYRMGPMKLSELAAVRGSRAYSHVKKLRRMGLVGVRKEGRLSLIHI